MKPGNCIEVENVDHLGLVAGIIDEIGLVEQINELLGQHPLLESECRTCCENNDLKWSWFCIRSVIHFLKIF